jgi:hypothetical protein
MENKVLTIDQMKKLVEMGIPVIQASMYYDSFGILHIMEESDRNDVFMTKDSENYGSKMPAFTSEDMLDIIPAWIQCYNTELLKDVCYGLDITKSDSEYFIEYVHEEGEVRSYCAAFSCHYKTLLEAAYNVLCFLKFDDKLKKSAIQTHK